MMMTMTQIERMHKRTGCDDRNHLFLVCHALTGDQYVAGNDEDLCRFRNITAAYYRGAQGVVLVYDITNRKSFEKVGKD